MILNKNQAFLLVTGISLFLVLVCKSYFLIRSNFTNGEVTEKHYHYSRGRYGGKSVYPVVKFISGDYEVSFEAGENLNYKIGDKVTVVYTRSDITNARIFSFSGFWLPGLLYGLVPFIFLTGIVFSFMDDNDTIEIRFDKSFSIRKTTNEAAKEK